MCNKIDGSPWYWSSLTEESGRALGGACNRKETRVKLSSAGNNNNNNNNNSSNNNNNSNNSYLRLGCIPP